MRLIAAGLSIFASCFTGMAVALADDPASEAADQRAAPRTVRDAVAGMADLYGFTIVGLNHLGSEAPDRPPHEMPPAALLQRLLRHYGYIAELKSGSDQIGGAVPQRLIIVGSSVPRPDGGSIAGPASRAPESVRSPAATGTAEASSVTRALTRLALASQPDDAAQPAGKVGKHSRAAMPNPSSGGPPVTSGLAALTRSAQANLAGLVISLQTACGEQREC